MLTKLQQREAKLERLWKAVNHLPKDQLFQIIVSFMSNEELNRALEVNSHESPRAKIEG